jgi:hypothetical protein
MRRNNKMWHFQVAYVVQLICHFVLINSTRFSGLCISSSYHSENLKSLLQISNSSDLISNVAEGDYKKFCNLKTVSLRCNRCCTLTNAGRAHWEQCWVLYTLVEIHITISHRSCVSFCLHHLTSIHVEIIQYEPGCISIEWETG